MKYIAAIEIGSSRIKGIVARVEQSGAISVLAVEEVDSGGTVRYGRVQNAREVSALAAQIIQRLENNPRVSPGRITSVFVAKGGRSQASAPASASVAFGGEAEITQQVLQRLVAQARTTLAADREVLAVEPRRFTVDNKEVKKVIGTFGSTVNADFTIITESNENQRALERVLLESNGKAITREYITRILAQTDMALTSSDRQLGSLFIDFGAETTTVAVFRDGSLQMVATLPMGSANITRDLSVGLSTTIENAEALKISKGRATADRVNIQAPDDVTREIINFVSARTGEIIANVIGIVSGAGFNLSELSGPVVYTGGGSLLPGFAEMLESQTRMKARRATVDPIITNAGAAISLDECFDLASIVMAATASPTSCVEFPAAEEHHAAASAATEGPQTGRRPNAPDIDDPGLLDDDDENALQPENINAIDDGEELPPQAPTADETRVALLARIRDWFTKPIPEKEEDLDK